MKIRINRFRSIGQSGVELPPDKLTAVLGPNGTGKTNFAQAILWALFGDAYYIASGKRIAVADLVMTGEIDCNVRLDLTGFYAHRFRSNGSGWLETDLATSKFDNKETKQALAEKIGADQIENVQSEIFRSLYLNPNSTTLLAMTPDQRARHLLSLFQGAILEEARAYFESEHRQAQMQIKTIEEMCLPDVIEKDTKELEKQITELRKLLFGVPNYRLEPALSEQKKQQERNIANNVGRIKDIENQLVTLGSPSEERIQELQALVKGKPHYYNDMGIKQVHLETLLERRKALTDESLAAFEEKSNEIVNVRSRLLLLKEQVLIDEPTEGYEIYLIALKAIKRLAEQKRDQILAQQKKALTCPACDAKLMLSNHSLEPFDVKPLEESLVIQHKEIARLEDDIKIGEVSLEHKNLQATIIAKEAEFTKLREDYSERINYNEQSISALTMSIKEAEEAKPFYEELDKLQKTFTETTNLKAELTQVQNALATNKANLAATEFDLTMLQTHKEDFLKLENLEADLKAAQKENEVIAKARELIEKKKLLEDKKPALEWIIKNGLPGLVSRVILPRVTSLRQEINNIFEVLETPYRVDFEPLVNNEGMLTGVKIRCYSNMRWTSYDDIGSMAQQNLFRLATILGERNIYGSQFKNIDNLLILDDPFSATYGDLAAALGKGIRKLLTGTVLVLTGYEHAAEFLYPDQILETTMNNGETSLRAV